MIRLLFDDCRYDFFRKGLQLAFLAKKVCFVRCDEIEYCFKLGAAIRVIAKVMVIVLKGIEFQLGYARRKPALQHVSGAVVESESAMFVNKIRKQSEGAVAQFMIGLKGCPGFAVVPGQYFQKLFFVVRLKL